jgi:acetoin utilization protein AcuB
MLVGEKMTHEPVTIVESASIDDGLHLMHERNVHRLPVLDSAGRLVGIVSDSDLLHASPSAATSLSVFELHYLLSKLTIKRVMSSPVISVTPSTPLEEAARIMIDNKIGGVPVLDGGALVGIVTESDILKILIDALGARTSGLRVTLEGSDRKGNLATLTRTITDLGGNIVSLVTSTGEQAGEAMITVKISEVEEQQLRKALAQMAGQRVVDLRRV